MVKQQDGGLHNSYYYGHFSAASGSTCTAMTTQSSLPQDQSIQSSTLAENSESVSAYGELQNLILNDRKS